MLESYSVQEGETVEITVVLSHPADRLASVDVSTSDRTAQGKEFLIKK